MTKKREWTPIVGMVAIGVLVLAVAVTCLVYAFSGATTIVSYLLAFAGGSLAYLGGKDILKWAIEDK